MRRLLTIACLLIVCSVTTTARAGDTIESVEKDILKKSSETQSFSATFAMASNSSTPNGATTSKWTGTIELLMDGDKRLVRMEMKTVSAKQAIASGDSTESSMLLISDGTVQHVYVEQATQKTAMKTKMQGDQPADSGAWFKTVRDTYNTKLNKSESLDGREVYVIEANAKKNTLGKTLAYFDKKSGILLKTVTHDTKGNMTNSYTVGELKINPKISKERFEFKVPAGVNIIDMTK